MPRSAQGSTCASSIVLEDADFATGTARVRDLRRGLTLEIPMRPLLGADGAGSLVRRRLAAHGLIEAEDVPLEHGYKELSIAAGPGGSALLEREALHIWPRGGYMLIALPNQDGSFTATLFLPLAGSRASPRCARRRRSMSSYRRAFRTRARSCRIAWRNFSAIPRDSWARCTPAPGMRQAPRR